MAFDGAIDYVSTSRRGFAVSEARDDTDVSAAWSRVERGGRPWGSAHAGVTAVDGDLTFFMPNASGLTAANAEALREQIVDWLVASYSGPRFLASPRDIADDSVLFRHSGFGLGSASHAGNMTSTGGSLYDYDAPTPRSVATSVDALSAQREAVGKPDERSLLVAEILAYRDLQPDWDGEGGDAPSQEAINEALRFLDFVKPDTKAKGTVSGDGEVGVYWRRPGAFIDVSFYGDGKIYYYARIDSDQFEVKGTLPFSGRQIPKDLARAIELF